MIIIDDSIQLWKEGIYLETSQFDVLIVDDTPENLYVLNVILSKVGYKVRLVTSAKQALSAIGNKLPDLILLDITMPDVNGYEFCSSLKNNPSYADIPVIFISALSDTIDKVKAFAAGGVDYVTKPFQTEEVLMRIETHLKIGALQTQLTLQNEKLLYLSTMDSLTGVYNRRCLVEQVEKLIETAQSMVNPFFIVIIDIDFFKKMNDEYGHQYGNSVLNTVSSVIKDSVGKEQMFGRYGGDEFFLICPNFTMEQLQEILTTIYLNVSKIKWDKEHEVTLSCGVSKYEYGDNFDSLVERADKKLFIAKNKGRNRIQY